MPCKVCAGYRSLLTDYPDRLECSLNGPFMRHSAHMVVPCPSCKEHVCDKDAGENITKDAACAKYFNTEAAGRIADRVLQMHGGLGYTKTMAIERLYRDARLLRIFEGTSQIQQIVISREMLRAAKSS